MLGLRLGLPNRRYRATSGVAAPDAPTSLTVAVVSTSQINLSWTDNATTETGYYVERSTNNVDWTVVGDNIAANSTSYNATGLTSNTLYYFRVRAANGAVYSDYSNTASTSTHALPSDISGLQNWYDAAVGVTLVDTNRVSQWNDQSGNARHATQGTPATRPVYNASLAAANNYPSIEFNGGYSLAFTNAITGTGARTIIVAIKSDIAGGGANQRIFNLNGVGGVGTVFAITDEIGVRANSYTWLSSTPAGTSPCILAVTYSGGNLHANTLMWKNNVAVTRTGGSDGVLNTGTSGEIGVYSGGYFDGHVMEICVWNKVLSTEEREKMTAYMAAAAKFNITL